MNKKQRTLLLVIGWGFTCTGGMIALFLALYFRKALDIAGLLINPDARPLDYETLASATAELIRLLMLQMFPLIALLFLVGGVCIIRVIIREKCGEQSVPDYRRQSAPQSEP